MASHKFNLSGLNNIYIEALNVERKTIVFEIRNGRGILVFMMFFSDEDESKDQLFLFLARTSQMLKLKMYGRHTLLRPELNEYSIFITERHQQQIKEELGIAGGEHGFDLDRFLGDVNAVIPVTLPTAELQRCCQVHASAFRHPDLRRVVDEALKIYLIGPKSLPDGSKPREKTLRKLYLHVRADPEVLDAFLTRLKQVNKTLAWTDDPERANNNIRQMLNSL